MRSRYEVTPKIGTHVRGSLAERQMKKTWGVGRTSPIFSRMMVQKIGKKSTLEVIQGISRGKCEVRAKLEPRTERL